MTREHAAMRRLLVVLGLFGLVLGLAAAVALHSLPAILVGEAGGFFLFSLGDSPRAGQAVSIYLDWWPSLLSLGSLGLVHGLLAAVVLGQLGWRLARTSG